MEFSLSMLLHLLTGGFVRSLTEIPRRSVRTLLGNGHALAIRMRPSL